MKSCTLCFTHNADDHLAICLSERETHGRVCRWWWRKRLPRPNEGEEMYWAREVVMQEMQRQYCTEGGEALCWRRSVAASRVWK